MRLSRQCRAFLRYIYEKKATGTSEWNTVFLRQIALKAKARVAAP